MNVQQTPEPPIEASQKLPADRMALLFTVMLVTAAGNTAMQSVMPAIGTRLGVADFWVSLAYSWSALLWMICAPRWARMSDRRGRKALMNLGLLGFISSFALCGLTLIAGLHGYLSALATMLIFALFRSLYGGLGSAGPPAVQAYVAARTSRAERTQALSMISSSFGLGTVIGPALAPLIILPYLGLPSPFFVFAAFGLLVLVTLKLRLPDDTPSYAARGRLVSEPMSSGSAGEVYDPQEHEAESEPAVPETARLSWRDARLRPWLIAGLVGGHANAMILGLVGFMLLDRLDLRATPELAAGPTGLVLMAGAFATLLAQWGLIPYLKMGPRTSTLWGMALAASGCTMVAFSESLNAITLGFAIASLGFGLFRPGFTAGSSLAVTRAEQGQVAGIVASVNGAAYIIAPAIGVWLYNIAPLESFAIIIGLCVFVLVWGRKALQADEVLVRPN
ncbi:MAG: multidrug transporter [Blastomonas sp. CACIA14H2]|uniref:MFS transporter n=1 Tax=Blastomonas sp. CACIA14H2 TaxID=1419876 RepID=UPI0003D04E91|nr:MAG: multidrug transporter [Blastomonas sp. CACIA14H2]